MKFDDMPEEVRSDYREEDVVAIRCVTPPIINVTTKTGKDLWKNNPITGWHVTPVSQPTTAPVKEVDKPKPAKKKAKATTKKTEDGTGDTPPTV